MVGRAYAQINTQVEARPTKLVSVGRNDTSPEPRLKVVNPDTGLPVSLLGTSNVARMYFVCTLKRSVTQNDVSFLVFEKPLVKQVKVGDTLVVQDLDQGNDETVVVSGVDVLAGTVSVARADSPLAHPKNSKLIFYRIFDRPAYIDSIEDDDPATSENEQDSSVIGYHWDTADTTHKGTYTFEFKSTDTESGKVMTLPEAGSASLVVQII